MAKQAAKLYATHVPTTCFQKAILAVGSSAAALFDPKRGDMVAASGETTAALVLPGIRRRMAADEEGLRILRDQPKITNETVDFDRLRKLPDQTFGREYMRFLDRLDTDPDARPPVQYIDDVNVAYVMLRYRQTHDLYHTVLNMPTNILGEVTVKWWEGIQLGLPMAVFGGLLGAVRLYPKQRAKFISTHLPFVVENAPRARFFMNVYWEDYWDWPLPELRSSLGISEPPAS